MGIWFYIIEFILSVIIILLYYLFVEIRQIKKYTKKNLPVDLKMFITSQKIDIKKVKYKSVMKIIAINNSICVAVVVLIITNITKSYILKLFIAIPSIIIVILMSYKVLGLIYKKKGLTIK